MDMVTTDWNAKAGQAHSALLRDVLASHESYVGNSSWRIRWARAAHSWWVMRYKTIAFYAVHATLSFLVGLHFFRIKLLQQEAAVPLGAPNYWGKRLIPPFEFGLMHVILYQLAWIPITMSRHLLTILSSTPLNHVVPFAGLVEFHIYIGYAICVQVGVATVVFFGFFGKVCQDFQTGADSADICEKFTSEIMITGYLIFVFVLVIFFSSFLRRHIVYEVFYGLHHATFVFFALTLQHTLDSEWRAGTVVGRQRSHSFRWIVTSLAIYFIDRAWLRFTAVARVEVSRVVLTRYSSILMLYIARPSGFEFTAGQFVYLRVPDIDQTWHPFSVASDSDEDELAFLIVTYGVDSWTGRLAAIFSGATSTEDFRRLRIDVTKGLGSSMGCGGTFDAVTVVGTGTGVVPMLSLLKERARRLSYLTLAAVAEVLGASVHAPGKRSAHSTRQTSCSTSSGGSTRSSTCGDWLDEAVLDAQVRYLQCLYRTRKVRKQGAGSHYMRRFRRAVLGEYGHAAIEVAANTFILVDMAGVFLALGGAYAGGDEGWRWRWLCGLTSITFSGFVAHRLYRWLFPARFPTSVWDVFDVMVVATTFGSLFHGMPLDGPSGLLRALHVLLAVWRSAQFWRASWAQRRDTAETRGGAQELLQSRSFSFLWIVRSVDFFLGCLPELVEIHESLVSRFTPQVIRTVLSITVHITGLDDASRLKLEEAILKTSLRGLVRFGRPDVEGYIKGRMQETLSSTPPGRAVRALVAYSGNPAVGWLCARGISEATVLAKATGVTTMHVDFREEYHGVLGLRPKEAPRCEQRLGDEQPLRRSAHAVAAEPAHAASLPGAVDDHRAC